MARFWINEWRIGDTRQLIHVGDRVVWNYLELQSER
jgi:hypothetical protein